MSFAMGEEDREDVEPGDSEPLQEPLEEADEVTQARAELEELQREKDQFRTIAQRAQADLVNYKRRVEEEREEFERRVAGRLLLRVLEVMDDFDRALGHLPPEDDREPWMQGIILIHQKLWALLGSEGVARIEAKGQPFNPWEHEAVFFEESESHPEGQVVQVVRDGYKLRDKVLRPAQVSVARAAQRSEQEEAGGSGPESER